MLNPQKRNLLLGTVAVLALIGVVGVVAKKKAGTPGTSTETPSESGHAVPSASLTDGPSGVGTPDAPGTPHLSQPAQPGVEQGSDLADGREYKLDSAPTLSLAMLSSGERARIEKEYPEFKNKAPRIHTAPGTDAQDEPTKHQPVSKIFPGTQPGGTEPAEVEVSLPKLTLAMLSPAERQRIEKKYPELFKKEEQTAKLNSKPNSTPDSSSTGSGAFVGPIPTKPGQPLVLLQPGMPGHPETPVIAKGTEVAQAPKPEPAIDSCYTVTYHHKHPGMRSKDETCSHHKNLIRIKPAEGLKLNPKTVCIRVNGTPVKATAIKSKSTDFIIGVVVGMDTAVTARYCTGKFRCNEDCKVPRDEFLESIAGAGMDTDESHKLEVAVWDKEDPNDKEANAKLAADMHKGLKDLDEVAKAAAEGYTLFEHWVPDQQQLACQNHQAQGPVADEADGKPHRKVAAKH